MTNFPKKIPLKVLTVFPCGRIVRFFAAAEAADELKSIARNVEISRDILDRRKGYFIISQRSLTKQITDKCECLGPRTV